MVVKTSLPN